MGAVTEHGVQAGPPEIEEIVSRLEFELSRSGVSDGSVAEAGSPLAARAEAERLAGVTADRPYLHKPGVLGRVRGAVLIPVKFVLRKLMRWYVEPVAADQRAFNASALRLVDAVSGRIDSTASQAAESTAALTRDIERLQAEATAQSSRLSSMDELDERLVRLERRPAGTAPRAPAPAAAPAASPDAAPFDYFAFESRMRGPRTVILERQREYVDEFRDAAPVLDVGCGRGEFLTLLGEAGIEARGIDLDSDMVAFCRPKASTSRRETRSPTWTAWRRARSAGIFAAQFVEHLQPGPLTAFLGLAAVAAAARAACSSSRRSTRSRLFALRNYFADLTHAQPLIPETLSLLVKQAGFGEVEIRFKSELAEQQLLEPVELPSEPQFDDARRALEANRARLNEVVFGPQDYALVARR